jgi:hypothetical protein
MEERKTRMPNTSNYYKEEEFINSFNLIDRDRLFQRTVMMTPNTQLRSPICVFNQDYDCPITNNPR